MSKSQRTIHNVKDGRRGSIGAWTIEPLVYDELRPEDIGRTVIYRNHGRADAGTITSWRNGTVFARYSRGDTAAGANATDLVFGIDLIDPAEMHFGFGPNKQEVGYGD